MTSHTSSADDHDPQARGPQIVAISVADEPEAWTGAGFAVDTRGRCKLGSVTIELAGGNGGVLGWSFEPNPSGNDLDGIALLAHPSDQGTMDSASVAQPNGIVSVDHVVVNSQNCDHSIASLEAAGFPARGGRETTSYGSPMRQTFFWAGDVIIELVGPAGGEPTASGPSSIFGLALVAKEIDETVSALGDLLGAPKPAVQPGRTIAGLRGKEAGITLPIAVMSPHPG